MANIGNKTYDLFKVEKILIGDPSLELDEEQMDVIDKEFIVPASVQLIKPIATRTSIDTEGDDNYRTIKDVVDPSGINFALYGLPLEFYPSVFGGEYDAIEDSWTAADKDEDLYKSIVVYTGITDAAGNQIKAIFPYCNVAAGFGGNGLTKGAIESVTVECSADKPVGMTATYKFKMAKTAQTS